MKTKTPKHILTGLKPFDERNSDLYYIDEAFTEKFFRSLKKNRFVFLIGDPGSGKTSFINCAVMVHSGHRLNLDTEHWVSAKLRPGRTPLTNLARALDRAQATTAKHNAVLAIEEILQTGSSALTEVFEKHPLRHNTSLLLVIDHLEDIFIPDRTQTSAGKVAASAEAQKLINMLWAFEHHNTQPVYIVISLSESYRERVIEHPKLQDLLQKRSFSFDGVSVQEIDAIVDRAIPGIWKGHKEITSIKRTILRALEDSQQRHALNPAWRYLVNHSLHYTFSLWQQGYQSVYKKIAAEPALKELAGNKYLPLLVNDLLRDEHSVFNATASKRSSNQWDKLSEPQQQALVRIIKEAKGKDRTLTLQGYYHAAGKIEQSLPLEVEALFRANPHMETVCELFVKTLTSRNGILEPLPYKTMVACLVGKNRIKLQDITRFITHFGDEGLGLVQVVPSSRIEESLNQIHNGAHIDDDATVSVRNLSLAGMFPKVTLWIKEESDCIQEYLLYAQAAAGKTASHPLTLERYANTVLRGDPVEDCEYSRIVHGFLQKDSTWAALHTPPGNSHASYEQVQKFVMQGIARWREINKAEEIRNREEKRIKRIKRYLIAATFVVVAVVALYSSFSIAQHRMLEQLDCMHDDCLRLSKEINLQYLTKDEGYEAFVSEWTKALIKKSEAIDNCIDSMYTTNEVKFIWSYRHWQRRRDALFGDSTRTRVLRAVIKEGFIHSEGGRVLRVDGYKIFQQKLLPPENVLYIVDCRKCDQPGWF
jgi:hypothetical protein